MIEAIAISSGTTARSEAKTKIRTASAPRPPISASSEEAGALAVGARVLEQRVEPGQVDGLAGHGEALERGRGVQLGLRVLAERRVRVRASGRRRRRSCWPSSETKVSSPVRGVGGDARVRERLGERLVDRGQVGLDGLGVDGLALRQRHDRHQRRGVAAGAADRSRRSARSSPSPPCRGPSTRSRARRWRARRPSCRRRSARPTR